MAEEEGAQERLLGEETRVTEEGTVGVTGAASEGTTGMEAEPITGEPEPTPGREEEPTRGTIRAAAGTPAGAKEVT
jgi:hypothetical protein